ncbi:MAG: RloB domain-containing protein, partial [Bacteroidota bacterium]
ERLKSVLIRPKLSKKKSLKDQFHFVWSEAESEEIDQVIWIFDLDVILKEDRASKKSANSPLDEFLRYRETLQKAFEKVTLLVNTPCLEFWFLLHF